MSKIRAVIFDYGGVIHGVPNARGMGIFETLCTGLQLDIEEFKALYFANNYRSNLQGWAHKQTLLHVVELLAEKKKDAAEKLIDEFLQKRTLNEELLDYIKKIKAQGYIVALLSNYNSELRALIAKNGVEEIFGNHIFISTEIGCQKPDPKIFEHTFKRLAVKPQEVIFVDDSPMSLSSAESVGYHPIRFIDNERLLKDLRSFGIKL